MLPWSRLLVLLACLALLAAATSPAFAQTPSNDATLSGLTLSEGRLSPAFGSTTLTYTAAVGYTVARVTVSPSTSATNAEVAYTDGNDDPLVDVDSAAGQQVDLVVGQNNVINVNVTAEDGNTTQTYAVTITRTEEDTSLSPPASDPVAAFPSTAVYTVTFTGAWTAAATPDGVPDDAQFSRLIGGVHNADVTFLQSGEMASHGVLLLAEFGTTLGPRSLEAEIYGLRPDALSVLRGPAPALSGSTALTAALTTSHPRVTLLAQVWPSPDWFVGVSGLGLLSAEGLWRRAHQVNLYPWDAGTEEGSEFSIWNYATYPPEPISSIRGRGKFSTEPIATLTFTLQSLSTTRTVPENTAAGVDIGAPVTPTNTTGTVTYSLRGTDATSFDIVASTGQLRTKAALDHETRSTYEVTVTATDSAGASATGVTINVSNVAELLPQMAGPQIASHEEDDAGRVATYSASSTQDRQILTWSLSGADSGRFSLDGGVLRFLVLPDYESAMDADADNVYALTLGASAGGGAVSRDVTITVTDRDEPGTLVLSSQRPQLGAELTASLGDPDGITGGQTNWFWERSSGRGEWIRISGATGSAYTPTAADTGHYLRATASYSDNFGTGKRLHAAAPSVVLAHRLLYLNVATTSSRQLYPRFDPQVLHYAVGCEETVTLALSTQEAGTRLAVNGVQRPSHNSRVELSGLTGESDIVVTLTGPTGASTTYTVHCLDDAFPVVEAVGESDTLMTISATRQEEFAEVTYLAVLDDNGVPRFRHRISGSRSTHFKYHPAGRYPYSYAESTGERIPSPSANGGSIPNYRIVVLDEHLKRIDTVQVAPPITHTGSHDAVVKPLGNYILMAFEPATRDLSAFRGEFWNAYRTNEDLEDSIIQEVTPQGVEAFRWNSWDHMALEDCMQHRFPWDYAHVNSLQDIGGDIVASFRGCSQVLRIDPGARGADQVVWLLGKSNRSDADWTALGYPAPLKIVNDPYGEFCAQHSARITGNGNLLIFDNGGFCLIDPETGESERASGVFSRVVEYAIDQDGGEAIFQRHHSLYDDFNRYARSQGHVELADNGNWIISWGRGFFDDDASTPLPPDQTVTEVNPETGEEVLSIRLTLAGDETVIPTRAYPVPPVALAPEPAPLTAQFPVSSGTSAFNSRAPQLVVSFTRPVVDFAADTPSVSVSGATVARVSPHVVAGEPANAYLFTFTPEGTGDITFRLLADQSCTSGGICTADRATLSEVPAPLVINRPVIVFTTGKREVAEGGAAELRFTITNGVTFEDEQVINLDVSATATRNADFTLADVVSIPPLQPTASVFLRALDDSEIEPTGETVAIRATLAMTGALLGSHTVTIVPSDVPNTPVVAVAPGNAITEGTDASFTFSRTAGQSYPLSDPLTVRVEVTARGSTLRGSPPTSVTFQANSATTTLGVETLDDAVVESPGAVTALILADRGTPPLYLSGARNAATVSVLDNDMAAFRVSAGSTEVAEGGAVPVTVEVTGVTFADAQALAMTVAGDATAGEDFTVTDGFGRELSPPYGFTLPSGATAATVTIRARRDSEHDAGEVIEVSISYAGGVIGAASITVTEALIPARPIIIGGGGGGGGGGPTPSEVDFEWTVKHDIEELDSGHETPSGAWSDGALLWLAENGDGADDAIYAYDLEAGERVPDREFALDERNLAPRGVWSDGVTVWVSDSGQNTLFAHDLETGERLPGSDIALAGRNGGARGIWSADGVMWVLDGGMDALFAYDLATGDPLAEYALDAANDDPHGLWSDGVTIWVSNHDPKRLFAYRLPVLPDGEEETTGRERLELERVGDEEFTKLSSASNNSPRGLWSDGDVMYVADASDGKVYSYNMPDAIDARLGSLTLGGVDIGEFDSGTTEYAGVALEGVTETTVAAEASQRWATVVIDPPDRDAEADGHQVALDGAIEITVTVSSADGSRERVYRVRLGEQAAAGEQTFDCFRGAVAVGFSLVVHGGGSVEEVEACAESRHITALYALEGGAFVSYILGAPEFVNRTFGEVYAGGLPALTVLTARSEGPPTADPLPGELEGVTWPSCLRGEIVTGFSHVLYEGGSVEELEACARSLEVAAVYALDGGAFVSYILGAPGFVNRTFREVYAGGLSALTPLIVRSDGPPSTEGDGNGDTNN